MRNDDGGRRGVFVAPSTFFFSFFQKFNRFIKKVSQKRGEEG